MAYSFPYILLIIFYGVMAILHKYFQDFPKKKTFINILSIVMFVFFFGFRGFVAYDWTIYFSIFTNTPTLDKLFTLPYNQWKHEPGFLILTSLCKTILPNSYIFFQVTFNTINIVLVCRFFKKYTDNIPACLTIFLPLGGTDFSVDLIRNSIAIFIFLNGIGFIEKKKFIPYIIICLIAASFHTSALAYIPLYFILNRRINKYVLLGIFCAANVICILHIPILKNLVLIFANILSPSAAQYIDAYMSYETQGVSTFNIGYLERLFTGIMLFCYIDKLRELRRNNILINSMFIYLFINLFLSEFRTISVRCSNLFIFAYWIIWQDFYKCLFYKGNKILYLLFVGCYCLMKTYSGNSNSMAQYYNVLFETKSHNERVLYFRQHQNDDK